MQIHIEVSTAGRPGRQRIATIERDADLPAGEGIGLTLDEVKGLVQRLQAIVATEHVGEIVAANSSCGECSQPLPRKGSASIVYRTAFGKLDLPCPRLYSRCRCGACAYISDSFNPRALLRLPSPGLSRGAGQSAGPCAGDRRGLRPRGG